MSFREYNEIIGQLYTEKMMLEGKIEEIRAEKNEKYTDDISNLYQENQALRKTVSDLTQQAESMSEDDDNNVISLRKQLQDMTKKKDMYRNERYELRRQIDVLERKIDRLMRD